VARLHLALKRREKLGWTQEELDNISTLDAWCESIDGKFTKEDEETELVSDDIKALLKDLPCHAVCINRLVFYNQCLPPHTWYFVRLHFLGLVSICPVAQSCN
jgi:hypothetical protein